jgi:tetratricopeptide (TPR) repeat protein
MYLLYVPEAFGGGPNASMPCLEKAIALFETEAVKDPIKPSWGRDEALAYLGVGWREKGDLEKAREFLKKALAVNPELSYARALLAELDKSR